MVDAADREKIEASRNELHNLLDKPQLQGIPVSSRNPMWKWHTRHKAYKQGESLQNKESCYLERDAALHSH